MTSFIDPDELPFTTDEIYRAACTFLPADKARMMADHLDACAQDLIAARTERRAGWRAAGVHGADALPLHGWVYPTELLPALAALTPDAAERVARLRRTLARDHRDGAV